MSRGSSVPRIVPPPPPAPSSPPGSSEPTHRRLRTIPQVAELMPGVSEFAIREWVRNADRNGFKRVMCRPSGNRIYVDIKRLDEWLEEKFGGAGEESVDDE